ncbi:hypothetical protein [Streptomyces chrestomyceticus]|uniref:hypothetical protein n=1 Tax=Streptomyces chrestomyceticus TaxID=68185 RepID=UPI0033FFA9EF
MPDSASKLRARNTPADKTTFTDPPAQAPRTPVRMERARLITAAAEARPAARGRYGTWRMCIRRPEDSLAEWHYLFSTKRARTFSQAHRLAYELHSDLMERQGQPPLGKGVALGAWTFTPAVRSRERAVAWAAAMDAAGVKPDHDWQPAGDDPLRRHRLQDLHHSYRKQVVAFGNNYTQLFASAVGTRADWNLEPYRDRCGRIDCSTVATAIEEHADFTTRVTPYGVLWLSHG